MTTELASRRHRARQLRAQIVHLAQRYRAAYEQHAAMGREILRFPGGLMAVPELILEHEQHVRALMEEAREELFRALEELDGIEEGQEGSGHEPLQGDRAD